MKRSILIMLFFCLLGPLSEAQLWKMKRYEAVAGFGPTLFFGDIGGFTNTKNILGIRDMSFLQTRFDLNFNLKYRITSDVNARLSFAYGFLHATDARGSNESRGYEASISIFESSLIGEYYFIKNRADNSYLFAKGRGNGSGGLFSSFDFYAFTGIGGLNYSVSPNDSLKVRQAKDSIEPGRFTAVIPVGLGATMIFSPDFNFGVEIGGRYSFSDKLDGFTSQYSSSKDVYYFFNFTITYKMKTGPLGLPSFR
ncbi:MAG: DUF6089 family protein [Bacteroidia bacterium]|nr:DUF6089 family protein [Bacteroidia bacterium]